MRVSVVMQGRQLMYTMLLLPKPGRGTHIWWHGGGRQLLIGHLEKLVYVWSYTIIIIYNNTALVQITFIVMFFLQRWYSTYTKSLITALPNLRRCDIWFNELYLKNARLWSDSNFVIIFQKKAKCQTNATEK